MPKCVVLYRIHFGDKDQIMTPYVNGGIVVIPGAVMSVVRSIEHDWLETSRTQNGALSVAINASYTSPGVIALGNDVIGSMMRWKILTDPFEVVAISFMGGKKFDAAVCAGDQAFTYWEKRSRKPALPKDIQELLNASNNQQPAVQNPLQLLDGGPAAPSEPEGSQGAGDQPDLDQQGQASPGDGSPQGDVL